MPIRLDCPRCKQPLAVPRKKAASYVNCPRCKGRFWVPDEGVSDGSDPADEGSGSLPPGVMPVPANEESGATSVFAPMSPPVVGPPLRFAPPPPLPAAPLPPTLTPLPVVAPPVASPGVPPAAVAPVLPTPMSAPARAATPSVASAAPAPAVPLPTPMPTPRRSVARLITAEMAESAIKPSADGKLPGLHLDEGRATGDAKAKGKSVHPLVLAGILCLSVALSVALVLVSTSDEDPGDSVRKVEARQAIESKFFAAFGANRPLQPYQVDLREAQQAHARGEYRAERAAYRKVLDLLRQERRDDREGERRSLTASLKDDKELESYICVLLSDR